MGPVTRFAIGLIAVLSLSGCGDPSKEDILAKAEGVETRSGLKEALGDPDDIVQIGPVAKWTYKAANGEVIFIITGDRVALEAATGK